MLCTRISWSYCAR